MGATQSKEYYHIYKTQRGSLRGVEKRDISGKPIYRRYTKIPYALPPVGDLRWRRPQRLSDTFTFNDPSGNPGDYTEFGPICPQPGYDMPSVFIDNPTAAPPIANLQDENCLYLNIWVPVQGHRPVDGWPVEFHIHGGWLQVGDACQSHDHDPFDLLAESTPRVIVAPTYRLNLFGFLAGADLGSLEEDPTPGNYGFWDQRCALEWTFKYINNFGGDPYNITVGGLSAGANSTFFQLYYDIQLPAAQQLIRRIYLRSNAVAIQPEASTAPALTKQFNDLCSVLSISSEDSASSKVGQLRRVPVQSLIRALDSLEVHTFRGSTDGEFVPLTFLSSIHSGTFARKLRENDIGIFISEVCDERQLYKVVNPPSSYSGLLIELSNYYPRHVVDGVLPLYTIPGKSETDKEPWAEVFSKIVADLQVHASVRGLTRCLLNPPGQDQDGDLKPLDFQRYRIEWRAESLDRWLNPKVGVCHSADTPIWWASGWRMNFTDEDKVKTLKFLETFGRFMQDDSGKKGTVRARKEIEEDVITVLDPDGHVRENVKDELWDRKLKVWNAAWEAQKDRITKEE